MAIDQHASNLIDITVSAFNSDVSSLSPTDGLSLVDSWLSFLKSDGQENRPITSHLIALRTELLESNLNGDRIQAILNDLVGQTTQLADSAEADNKSGLTTLSDALQGFNQQLNAPTPMTDPNKQAPLTSTVGGESTTSGAGISAVGASDDDLSNRNGGTVSSGPSATMNDSAGSNGTTSDSSKETDRERGSQTTGNSSNSLISESDGANTGQVRGMGISGGESDSE